MPLMLKMIDVFGSIRSLFKVHRIAEDSMMFRLHYRATVAVLLAGCLILTCKSISGSPIHCEVSSGSVDKTVLETFCWLHTTYSMVRAFNMSVGQAVPYPGVSNSRGDGTHGHAPHPLVKQHKYYQWVIFLLLLQVRGGVRSLFFSVLFSLTLLHSSLGELQMYLSILDTLISSCVRHYLRVLRLVLFCIVVDAHKRERERESGSEVREHRQADSPGTPS